MSNSRRQRLAEILHDPATSDDEAQEVIVMIEALDDAEGLA